MPIYDKSVPASSRSYEESDDSNSLFDKDKSKLDSEIKDDIPRHERLRENLFEANEENILSDSLYVYDYINKVMGIDEENIIIFGRSIGSGPATHVASKRKPSCLLLMSAFKSIRAIA